MRIGILSDTHGHHERCGRAVRLLKRLGAEALIHCGDIGSAAVLDVLAGEQAWFVWGNTDAPVSSLAHYAQQIGLTVPTGPVLKLELSGRRLAVFHGHESLFAQVLQAARAVDSPERIPARARARKDSRASVAGGTPLDSRTSIGSRTRVEELIGPCDAVLCGHSHVAIDAQIGPLRLINPGALFRAAMYTVATLDTAGMTARFWRVVDAPEDRTSPQEYTPPGER